MLRYFIVLFISIVFSLYVVGIEMSSDLFIEVDNNEEAVELKEAAGSDVQSPKIKKVYKRQKVTIKRDISTLDQVVNGLQEGQVSLRNSKQKDNEVFSNEENQSGARELSADEESLNQSVDYGDYEVHWGRKKELK